MAADLLIDLKNTTVGGVSIVPQTATADVNGTAVDMNTSEGPVHAVLCTGAKDTSSADETYAVKLQESDTSGGTYTDITGGSFATPAADAQQVISVPKRTKRWVRAQLDVGGTTPSLVLSVGIFARKKISGTGEGYDTKDYAS